MRKSCVWFIYATLLIVFLGIDAHSRAIDISNVKVKQIDAYHFKAASYNRIGDYATFFNSTAINQEMTSFFKQVGIYTFRLHAPVYQHTNANFRLWQNLAFYGASPLQDIVDDFDFVKWAYNNGFKVILQVNTSNYYDTSNKIITLINDNPAIITKLADSHADFIYKLKQAGLLSTILYVEFGNEDYIGMTTYPGTKPLLYAKTVKETIDRIKPITKDIKYCIVGQSIDFNVLVPKNKGEWTVGDWTKTVLLELKRLGVKDDISYVAHHCYADDQATGSKLSTGSRMSAIDIPSFQDDWSIYNNYKVSETGSLDALKGYLDDIGFTNTLIEVNEFRRGGYNTYYNRSYMNLLANLDPWVTFINDKRVSGSLLWETFNGRDLFGKVNPWEGPTGYGVILRKANGFELSMPGYLYFIMKMLFDGQSTVLKTSDPMSCAVIVGNKLKIMVYSKSLKTEQIALNLIGFNNKVSNVKQFILNAESIDDFITNPSTLKSKTLSNSSLNYDKFPKSVTIEPHSINIISCTLE